MKNLAKLIVDTKISTGDIGIFWLGQAGFVFKTQNQKILYIDPYLTNYVQKILPEYGIGFKRIMPTLIEPEEVKTDYVITTHSHGDHFDADTLSVLSEDPNIHFIGASDCKVLYEESGISKYTILRINEKLTLNSFYLTGTYVDHCELSPEAIGLLFDFDCIKIWYVGDSAYRPDMWDELISLKVDILIPPINGAFGNMNEVEAAKLAGLSNANVVIPCHFWMFPLHFGQPVKFLEACKKYAPNIQSILLEQGELYVYRKE